MGTLTDTSGPGSLPAYIQDAKPNPVTNRAPWYKNTAPTYAGIFLWFVFWDEMASNGLPQGGLGIALLGVVLAGLICHLFFYLIPGLFGMKTGLPLYIVGTSTFGALGGLLMPGLLMGVLQFGWLAVNTYFSSSFLANEISKAANADRTQIFYVLCVLWAAGAAFVGLKGIQYVAKVATFVPLIPLAVLVLALVKFGASAPNYQADTAQAGSSGAATSLFLMVGAIVGFFATAGAAGVDFGMNNRNAGDVNWGGIWGILIATVITAGVATFAVAGAQAMRVLPNEQKNEQIRADMKKEGKSPEEIDRAIFKANHTLTNAFSSAYASGPEKGSPILPPGLVTAIMIGLTIAAFPGACFSSFIAANSFKTVLPQVNPFVSVGIGALVSIALAVTKVAGNLAGVFGIIGASFGPICGAMFVDYFLSGRKWAGPRAGFNPAGWLAWLLGFFVGIMPNLHGWNPAIPDVPAAPVAAFIVGAVVYALLAAIGLQSRVIPYAPAQQQQAA